MKTVLRTRSLLIMGIAESVSGTGNWITAMALFTLIVFSGRGGVVESSGIFLASLAPTLLFSTLAGWLCDRFDRKWLMVASEILSGLSVVAMIFAIQGGQIALLYVLMAVQATVGCVMTPARQSSVPSLVPTGELTQANAFLQQLSGIIKIGAPFFGGMILAVLEPQQAMILDVISFGLSALMLTRLPALVPEHQATAAQEADKESAPSNSVWGLVRENPRLRLLLITGFLLVIIMMSFDVLSSIFTRDVLAGDSGLFGIMIAMVGLGTVAVSAALLVRKGQHDPWNDMVWALLLLDCLPATLALATLVSDPLAARVLVLAGCLLGGVGNGLIGVQAGTLLQVTSPSRLLGRMSGLFQSTLVAGQLISIFITPLLVPALVSMGFYLGAGAVAVVLLAAYTVLTLSRTGQGQVPALATVEVTTDGSR